MTLYVTLGDRLESNRGVEQLIEMLSGRVNDLATFLAREAKRHLWWSLHRWKGKRRSKANWRAAGGVALDLDYNDDKGEHVELPETLRTRLLKILDDRALPGNIGHLTPRGIRLIALFDGGNVTDPEECRRATLGFAALVEEALAQLELSAGKERAGLVVDNTFDLARIMFLANTKRPIPSSDGEKPPRKAKVFVLDPNPISVSALLERAPAAAPPRATVTSAPTGRSLPRAALAVVDAAERWVADHPLSYPASGTGTCPMCGHNGCFGRLKNEVDRWSCFSANHAAHSSGWPGKEGDGVWIGSSLDIEANKRGCKPRDVLLQDGYLQPSPNGRFRNGRSAQPPGGNGVQASPAANDDRPRIFYEPHNLGRVVEQVLAVFAAEDPPRLFQSAGVLVAVVSEDVPHHVSRVHVKAISVPLLKSMISERVVFQRLNLLGRPEDVGVPDDVARGVFAMVDWPGLPVLRGTTRVPILRDDGSLHSVPGFDPQTGFYFAPVATAAVSVPDAPTRDDAVSAANWIFEELLTDFPFCSASDRSALLAELLTGCARATVQGPTPAFLHKAPVRGSGKTLGAQLTAILLIGERAPVVQPPTSEAEWRKLLFAASLACLPLFVLDNVEAGSVLRSACLDMVLTSGAIMDRVLGVSRVATATFSPVVVITGNNVRLGGDLPRRVVPIVLDARVERPETRTGFKRPALLDWVLEHRSEILARLLTILRAYRLAARPRSRDVTPFGGFESWDREVRHAILWLAFADPLAGVEAVHAGSDDDTAERGELLECLHGVFGENQFSSNEAHAAALGGLEDSPGVAPNGRPQLTARARLLHALRPEGRRLSVVGVGRQLSSIVDAPASGLVLRRGEAGNRDRATWHVEPWAHRS